MVGSRLLLVTALAAVIVACRAGSSVQVVDTRNVANGTITLAVLCAAGLDNRQSASTFVIGDDYDPFWLESLLPNASTVHVQPLQYLSTVFEKYGAVRYSSDPVRGLNSTLLPSVVTLAGLFDAVPMDEALERLFPSTKVVFDTTTMGWTTPEDAVKYCATPGLLNQTTSLAMQDGLRLAAGGFLADFIVSKKMFAMYLAGWCPLQLPLPPRVTRRFQ